MAGVRSDTGWRELAGLLDVEGRAQKQQLRGAGRVPGSLGQRRPGICVYEATLDYWLVWGPHPTHSTPGNWICSGEQNVSSLYYRRQLGCLPSTLHPRISGESPPGLPKPLIPTRDFSKRLGGCVST